MNAHSRMEISFHCCQGRREKRVICYCNLQPIQYSQLQMLVPVGSIVDPDPIKYIYLDLGPTQILIYCGKKKEQIGMETRTCNLWVATMIFNHL